MFAQRQGPMEPDQSIDPPAKPIERRRFLRLLLGFSVVSTLSMVAAPIIGFLVPNKTAGGAAGDRVLAGTTDSISIGRSKVVAVGSKPVIVLNTARGVKAFSAVCTHLGCIVGYDETRSPDIVSPCHNGHFSALNGSVLSGPPPLPLAEYAIVVEKKQIFVLGKKA